MFYLAQIMLSRTDMDHFLTMPQIIAALEEIAYVNKWIDKATLLESAQAYGKSPYGDHLKAVAEGRVRY